MSPVTTAPTTALKAAPMTTATARSTTLPRSRNFLKPSTCTSRSGQSAGIMHPAAVWRGGRAGRTAPWTAGGSSSATSSWSASSCRRAARAGHWVLVNDHCFGRVLLDDAVGGCWYDVLDRRRTAFRQLDDAQLAAAVALGERLLREGDPLLRELDARSLAWRGKPPKRVRPAAPAAVTARLSRAARPG